MRLFNPLILLFAILFAISITGCSLTLDFGKGDFDKSDASVPDGSICLPNCVNRSCGADSCSGSCGICADDQYCDSTGKCQSNDSILHGLYTAKGHIYKPNGALFLGRGANIHDTRSCDACSAFAPNVDEVKRRIDELVDNWHANFVRLNLESYSTQASRDVNNWKNALNDNSYLADIVNIVKYLGRKDVYVMISIWLDPTIESSTGLPTIDSPGADTVSLLRKLVSALGDQPQVLYGIINEPKANLDGSQDAAIWTRMNAVAEAIRRAEDDANYPHRIIAVQGTRNWARFLDYYIEHPITAHGGINIAYETHAYGYGTQSVDSQFQELFVTPSEKGLPVIIGAFGPTDYMSVSECAALAAKAESLNVPYLAWTFHMRCSPNLLIDNSSNGCGVGMALKPTSWGTALKNRLSKPWGNSN